MAYAIFSMAKLVDTSKINSINVQQTQRSNEQFALANDTTELKQQLSSLQVAQSSELADLYSDLANATNETQREQINYEIKAKELEFEAEEDEINRQITQASTKENALELEIKALETEVSVLNKQLEAVQSAESSGMDRATPKYSG